MANTEVIANIATPANIPIIACEEGICGGHRQALTLLTAVIQKASRARKKLTVDDLLKKFADLSGKEFANDRTLLN